MIVLSLDSISRALLKDIELVLLASDAVAAFATLHTAVPSPVRARAKIS